jgi:putative pyruvate formate lyase activating enzyme
MQWASVTLPNKLHHLLMERPQMAIYLELFHSGELDKRVKTAKELLQNCQVCPRKCNVDRLSGETGYCRTPNLAAISSYRPHFGEESPLVGNKGSGTIFFTNCNLSCVFC